MTNPITGLKLVIEQPESTPVPAPLWKDFRQADKSPLRARTFNPAHIKMNERVRKRILFVDKDEALRLFCSEVLTGAGYSVEVASSGAEAYVKLRKTSFDLVITDVLMPGLDGIGLYLNTLKIYADMKERFLFMTEEPCGDFEPQGASDGMSGKYLIKPFDIRELLKKVEGITGEDLTEFLLRFRNLGENRRQERRWCWAEDCVVAEEGPYNLKPFAATTDISRHGLRVRYMGRPMRPEGMVRVSVKYLEVKSSAKVVWSKPINDREASSGLSLSEPVPSASLANVMQGKKTFVPPVVSKKPVK